MPLPDTPTPTVPTSVRQRAEDLHERARLGGIFYVLSWLLVAGFGDGWERYPVVSGVLTAAFMVLLVARMIVRGGFRRDPDTAAASIRRQWAVLLATGVLWGAVSGWALRDPTFAAARPLTLIATSSLAMAFAQIFAVDPRLSLLGTATVYVPMSVAVWLDRDAGVAWVLALNAVYLIAVIGRSHREYEGKLALDDALRHERDRFAVLSRTDALTALANRGEFQRQLEDAVIEASSTGLPLALLIADLDHFKAINDRYGHSAGDRVLKTAAGLLADEFPAARIVARIGGEEFAVLATGDDAATLALHAETLRARLARTTIDLGGGMSGAVTISLGLATFDVFRHADADAIYAAADEALYRAKEGGRNRLEAA